MRVLVTGHLGYLGSVLTPLLGTAGHEVTGLDTGLFADCLLGPPPPTVPTLPVDLRDVRPEHCAGFDAVCHLAALSNDPVGDLDPALTREINHRATLRLARAARRAGVPRFLFSSSCSLYGASGAAGPAGATDATGPAGATDAAGPAGATDAAGPAGATDATGPAGAAGDADVAGAAGAGAAAGMLTEAAGFAPVTAYGESKVDAERELAGLADDRFCPVLLRNATAYGYSPRLRTDLVVNDLTAHALLTGEVRLLSDGAAWRPLVHVEDIAAAFLALLRAPADVVRARAYNIGRGDGNHRIRQVAELVAELVPGSRVTLAGGAGRDRRDYRVDCDRIRREVPEFRPRWTVRDGVGELVAAYRRHGLTTAALDGDGYQRLRRIRALRAAGRLDPELRWTRRADAAASPGARSVRPAVLETAGPAGADR